jgi:hypothetical protein
MKQFGKAKDDIVDFISANKLITLSKLFSGLRQRTNLFVCIAEENFAPVCQYGTKCCFVSSGRLVIFDEDQFGDCEKLRRLLWV